MYYICCWLHLASSGFQALLAQNHAPVHVARYFNFLSAQAKFLSVIGTRNMEKSARDNSSAVGQVLNYWQFHKSVHVYRSYNKPNYYYNYNPLWFSGFGPGIPWWAGTRKVKPLWISWSKTMSSSGISYSALRLLVGWQEGHPACKKTEWWSAGVVIWGKVEICIRPADATAAHCLLLK